MVWCFVGLRSVLCAGQSISSTPNLLIDVFIDLALCSGVQSYWNEKSPSPNSSHKVGDMKLSKISWYAEILRVTFTGTKGPSLNPEEQPHTIIPHHQTLHINNGVRHISLSWHCQTQTCLSDCQMGSVISICTALEASGGVLYATASNALHCTWRCKA